MYKFINFLFLKIVLYLLIFKLKLPILSEIGIISTAKYKFINFYKNYKNYCF